MKRSKRARVRLRSRRAWSRSCTSGLVARWGGQPLDHQQIRPHLRTDVVADLVHQRPNEEDAKAGDASFIEVHVRRFGALEAVTSAVVYANAQQIRERFAGQVDEFAVPFMLNHGRAGLRDGQLYVLDLFDRKVQAVGHGRGGEAGECDPFGPRRNAQLDELLLGRLEGWIHTNAFIAASSLSKMPKILTNPVMSKIFLICGFVQTRLTDPPCSRTRLSPPIKTPKPVESI